MKLDAHFKEMGRKSDASAGLRELKVEVSGIKGDISAVKRGMVEIKCAMDLTVELMEGRERRDMFKQYSAKCVKPAPQNHTNPKWVNNSNNAIMRKSQPLWHRGIQAPGHSG